MYTLIVENLGTMPYDNEKDAMSDYNQYVYMSQDGYGRIADCIVTLMKDDDIIKQYVPAKFDHEL